MHGGWALEGPGGATRGLPRQEVLGGHQVEGPNQQEAQQVACMRRMA